MRKKFIVTIRKTFHGYGTEDGKFYKNKPTGTFANYPELYPAHLVVILPESEPANVVKEN